MWQIKLGLFLLLLCMLIYLQRSIVHPVFTFPRTQLDIYHLSYNTLKGSVHPNYKDTFSLTSCGISPRRSTSRGKILTRETFMQPGTDVLWLWPAFIYMYSISDDGVSPSLTVIHLISDDWSNCSARLSLFSLLDRLLPWWMRAWFDRVCLCVCVGVSFEILVCVYPWHRESICACSVCTLCVCVCVSVLVRCICWS